MLLIYMNEGAMNDAERADCYLESAETREQLGGYFLVDAKDLDEAVGIAARIPAARKGAVEIRPVMEVAGLPRDSCLRRAVGKAPWNCYQ